LSSTQQPQLRDLLRRLVRILRPYRYVFVALLVLNFVLGLFFLGAFLVGPAGSRSIALEQMIILFGLAIADGLFLLAMRNEGRLAPQD
jgi:hypothetical protein